jgi:hypothetical protein
MCTYRTVGPEGNHRYGSARRSGHRSQREPGGAQASDRNTASAGDSAVALDDTNACLRCGNGIESV